jgi:hypothetical protein
VWVHAEDTCFVAGELTAWRVRSRKIILEKNARANIMLQESETVELDRAARLVGNFANPGELSDMLVRFSRQLEELAESSSRDGDDEAEGEAPPKTAEGAAAASEASKGVDGADDARADSALATARTVLEKELGRSKLDEAGQRAVEKMLDLVNDRKTAELAEDGGFLISQVSSPSTELKALREVFDRLAG